MRKALDRVFLDHPRSVDESYAQHAGVALHFATRLLGAGVAALVHAAVPCLFEKTASSMIKATYDEMTRRTRDGLTAR